MIEGRCGTRFLSETLQPFGIGGERRGQNLDRDVAAESLVARAVDFTHPASADDRLYLVWAQARSRNETHVARILLSSQDSKNGPQRHRDSETQRHGGHSPLEHAGQL
jgi:hypothetical protein